MSLLLPELFFRGERCFLKQATPEVMARLEAERGQASERDLSLQKMMQLAGIKPSGKIPLTTYSYKNISHEASLIERDRVDIGKKKKKKKNSKPTIDAMAASTGIFPSIFKRQPEVDPKLKKPHPPDPNLRLPERQFVRNALQNREFVEKIRLSKKSKLLFESEQFQYWSLDIFQDEVRSRLEIELQMSLEVVHIPEPPPLKSPLCGSNTYDAVVERVMEKCNIPDHRVAKIIINETIEGLFLASPQHGPKSSPSTSAHLLEWTVAVDENEKSQPCETQQYSDISSLSPSIPAEDAASSIPEAQQSCDEDEDDSSDYDTDSSEEFEVPEDDDEKLPPPPLRKSLANTMLNSELHERWQTEISERMERENMVSLNTSQKVYENTDD